MSEGSVVTLLPLNKTVGGSRPAGGSETPARGIRMGVKDESRTCSEVSPTANGSPQFSKMNSFSTWPNSGRLEPFPRDNGAVFGRKDEPSRGVVNGELVSSGVAS